MGFWKNCKKYGAFAGILLGILFLFLGTEQGELTAIREKAVMICMECIGLG